ncbi:MAG TPA: hypothetical protein VH083_05900 [Myxococcales bacterium]|nr:hypothetical protein [Myxococcales bacterium]
MNSAAAILDDEPVPQREAHALFFRSVTEFLVVRHLLEPVRKLVPEQTRRSIDQPPWIGRWFGSQALEDIQRALHDLGGAPLNLQMGRFSARRMSDGRLRPVIAGIFAVLGKSPESLFKSLDVCFSLAIRGVSFRYEVTETERFVIASFRGGNVPEGMHHALRGAFLHVFELANAQGEIAEPELLDEEEGCVRVRYLVRF